MRPLVIAALLVHLPGAAATAQTPRGIVPGPAAALERAEELHYRMRPRDAVDTLRAALERHPGHYDLLISAAREAVNLGILSSDEEGALRWYREGEGYARRALDANPSGTEARYWLAAALGRRALREDPRDRVRLAGEIRSSAEWVLARDSTHAGAHHVLGKWHVEVRSLGALTRFVAERLLGGEGFGDASWEAAHRHLERAVELSPEMLLFRLDLARAYADTDRREAARLQLREVLDRPTIHPIDPQMKQTAQELLKSLQ